MARGFLGRGVWGATQASQTLFFIASIIPTIFCDYGERIFRQRGLGSRAAYFVYVSGFPSHSNTKTAQQTTSTLFCEFSEAGFRRRGFRGGEGVADAFLYSLYYPHYFL